MDVEKNREDGVEAAREREKALDRLEVSNEGWIHHAVNVIHALCTGTGWFTSDDVWRLVDYMPASNLALGAAMRKASKLKYCERTSETRPSHRIACHRRPVRVWRSLLWRL